MSKYGPRAQLTANTQNWSVYYIDEVKKAMAGKWTGNRQTRWGIKENMVVLTPLNKSVPADVVKLFEERKQGIVAGTLNPFAGPLSDNAGVVKVPAGKVLPEKDLLSMNWYVAGVEGSIPK
jgi:simple sugar transport system substrate-binding protein